MPRHVPNQIQERDRRRIFASLATEEKAEAHHLVRRHAVDSSEAIAIRIPRCQGFWVIYPRYRGAWESGGDFLAKSPHEDVLEILDSLPTELEEIAFGQRFRLAPDQVFVIGGSFGGAAAILLSLDSRVNRVVANCSVVDWSILDTAEKAETASANYAEYIREAFGNAYRLSDANWEKLRSGTFYNP
jgi:pimeloyl-ACP methyl ester carboxylesterase